jgi:hypothetical protein
MVNPIVPPKPYYQRLTGWLLMTNQPPHQGKHSQHPWWQVMCLTGVDYFSTLGYQPGIAALAAGNLSPLATLILVLVTLFGALPIYRRVASLSPHGEGSIAMLEHLLPRWQGKILVLCLLGFVATDFMITITLSAADATAHIIQNPFITKFIQGQEIPLTLILVALLESIFLKGFQEAIKLAVFLVVIYLSLNFIVITVCLAHIVNNPTMLTQWQNDLFISHNNLIIMIGIAVLLFPKLALGLSGFETGVAVMPLVKGASSDTEEQPTGRIKNTHKLLATAAIIMSFFLLTSSIVTTVLIEPIKFQEGGEASGRALAYLAHSYLGEFFGSLYDLSTIAILWFAGASAMAGLLNIVPRYLPRYGMAPAWTLASRPLVFIYTIIAFVITLIFRANVEAQGGAYATGVLVLMSSAAFAVTLSTRFLNSLKTILIYSLITLVFLYTTITNVIERPDGIRIATFFIGTIIITSLISRVLRSTELRVERVELDETATMFIQQNSQSALRLIANRRNAGNKQEYYLKEREVREDNHIPAIDSVIFLEITISDPSDFKEIIQVQGIKVGEYRILQANSASVPNAIAAILLTIRDQTGKIPHAYFGWIEGNPIQYLLRFILFGEGDIPVVTREVLRKAEPDPDRRPAIHVGG